MPTVESQREYRKRLRARFNDKKAPHLVEILDPKLSRPYYITKTELALYKRDYYGMSEITIMVDGMVLRRGVALPKDFN